jgi:hypothetical protein
MKMPALLGLAILGDKTPIEMILLDFIAQGGQGKKYGCFHGAKLFIISSANLTNAQGL